MNKFTTFAVNSLGDLFGVWSDNTDDKTYHLVEHDQWENDYGVYDPEHFRAKEYSYDSVKTFDSLSEALDYSYTVMLMNIHRQRNGQ
jgi:hypothetical protein